MGDYFNTARRWNLLHGCRRVSPGCEHCWAERMANRHCDASTRNGRWSGEVVLFPERLSQPLHWRKPAVVAVQFMGDLFHERVPFEFIAAVFGVMAACPQHTFLLLTKRPERMAEFHQWCDSYAPDDGHEGPFRAIWDGVCDSDGTFPESWDSEDGPPLRDDWPLPNVWLGISAENQKELEKRWDSLRSVPAAHYWLSLEPLLGPVTGLCGGCGCDARAHRAPDGGGCSGLFPDFVAVGPETGPKRRPCDVAWIRSVVKQCQDAHVPVHVKALEVDRRISHDPREWPEDLSVQDEVPW